MSSRSIGVTKVELSRLTISWVIRSPSCSAVKIARPSSSSSGQRAIIWSSSRAALSVLVPASTKRSKNVRSRGRSESRAIAAILVVAEDSARRRRELLGGASRVPLLKLLLGVAALLPADLQTRPAAVRAELPGVGIVCEPPLQDVEELGLEDRVL